MGKLISPIEAYKLAIEALEHYEELRNAAFERMAKQYSDLDEDG